MSTSLRKVVKRQQPCSGKRDRSDPAVDSMVHDVLCDCSVETIWFNDGATMKGMKGTELSAISSQGSRAISTQVSAVRGGIRHSVLSSAKAEKVLGFRPAIPFDEGLRATVEWFMEELTPDSEER